ncbi:MAG: MarR family transcriptional regulator [Bacteroidales bacterium]|nr:MarR family transcriptional regulator [Bacteroidales bacterium]
METTQKVLDTMKGAGKALKAGEIAEIAGLDRKEVDKAMKVLKKEEKIVSPKVCFWEAK